MPPASLEDSQGELARPYTAAFVSRVEHGDAIPSLGSLEVLTARLAMTLEEFFRLVEQLDAGEAPEAVEHLPLITPSSSLAECEGGRAIECLPAGESLKEELTSAR